MDWKGHGKKEVQPNPLYYSDIWLAQVRKTMKNLKEQSVSGQL
jgi:hypothetical protein